MGTSCKSSISFPKRGLKGPGAGLETVEKEFSSTVSLSDNVGNSDCVADNPLIGKVGSNAWSYERNE